MFRTLCACLAVALFAGCNRPNFDTPVAAYQSFLRALDKGETELAYSALSSDTRKILEARTEEISKASGGAVRNDAAAVFFTNAARPSAVREVKVLREEESRAVLAVEAGGETQEVAMVRESSGWRIDLAAVAARRENAQVSPPAALPPADGGS